MQTLYSKIGPENLKAIIDGFYDLVFANEKIGHLFKTNQALVREKQYQFLTQFLGGPQLYSANYGHPKMRMRHLPHRIDSDSRDEWLNLMRESIYEVLEDKRLAEELYNCFPKLVNHMVNR